MIRIPVLVLEIIILSVAITSCSVRKHTSSSDNATEVLSRHGALTGIGINFLSGEGVITNLITGRQVQPCVSPTSPPNLSSTRQESYRVNKNQSNTRQRPRQEGAGVCKTRFMKRDGEDVLVDTVTNRQIQTISTQRVITATYEGSVCQSIEVGGDLHEICYPIEVICGYINSNMHLLADPGINSFHSTKC